MEELGIKKGRNLQSTYENPTYYGNLKNFSSFLNDYKNMKFRPNTKWHD